jgi:hypothetical protein
MRSTPEERVQFGKVHAGQCIPCVKTNCPLFGQQISLARLTEHEASHRSLPTKPEELSPGVEETLRDLKEAGRPNPDLNGMVFGGTGIEDIAKSPTLSAPISCRMDPLSPEFRHKVQKRRPVSFIFPCIHTAQAVFFNVYD